MHAHTRFLRYGTFSSTGLLLMALAACRSRPGLVPTDASASATPAPAAVFDGPSAPEEGGSSPQQGGVSLPLVASAIAFPQAPPRASGQTFPAFKKTTLPLEQVAQMVAAAPELGRLGGDVALFDPGDSPYLRRSKADPATREAYTITPLPVLWSPSDGVQILVVTGRGKEGSFIAAWWPLPDGQYRLASAFVMLGEIAPVALAFRTSERTLEWTTCWRCSGEGGHLAVRDDGSVVILQD